MLTKTDVANLALGKLGHSHVVPNLDTDNTTIGKILRRQLPTALSSVVELHPWGFLTSFDALTKVEDNPQPNWRYSYSTPADCEVIRRISPKSVFFHEQEYDFQKEQFIEVHSDVGILIYANIDEAWAEFTRKHDADSDYPTYFARAVACQLAMDAAPSIITNNYAKMKDTLLRESKTDMSNQIAMDMSRVPQPLEAPSPFLRARTRQ